MPVVSPPCDGHRADPREGRGKDPRPVPSSSRPAPSLSPDDAGYAGLSGQQRQHGVVGVALLEALLARRLGLWPLSVDEGHGDVAVGVLVA